MRRHTCNPTIDGRILEPRVLLSGAQPPAGTLDPAYTPPDPGPTSSPPGDYPATDPGIC